MKVRFTFIRLPNYLDVKILLLSAHSGSGRRKRASGVSVGQNRTRILHLSSSRAMIRGMRVAGAVESVVWGICAYFWFLWVTGAGAPTALWLALVFFVLVELARRTSSQPRAERPVVVQRARGSASG